MPLRIDVDFRQGLTVPEVERLPDGTLELSLARGRERVMVHLSLPSLEALWFTVMTALTDVRRC